MCACVHVQACVCWAGSICTQTKYQLEGLNISRGLILGYFTKTKAQKELSPFQAESLRTRGTGEGFKSFKTCFRWITVEHLCRVSVGPSDYRNSRGHSSGSMFP